MIAQPKALRIADECEQSAKEWLQEVETRKQAAAELRRLVAENEAKDALLHRAFTAVEAAALDESKDARQRRQQIATAIRQHLGQKGETG